MRLNRDNINNNLERIENIEDNEKNLLDSYLFRIALFYVGYYINKKWEVYKIYYKKNNKIIDVSSLKNGVILEKLSYLLIDEHRNDKFILKKLDNPNIKEIIWKASFYNRRLYILYGKVQDIKEIKDLNDKLLEFYRQWWLTFPDILKFYIDWWITKQQFKEFLDKVIRYAYLVRQFQDERFYRIFQNMDANKEAAKEFLEKNRWKSLKEIVNNPTNWVPFYLFNLYVREAILKVLKDKWVISEDEYRRYKKEIDKMIRRIEEDWKLWEAIKKIEKDKEIEKQKQIKEIKKRIDEFLNSVNVEKWYYYLNEKDSGEFFDRYK